MSSANQITYSYFCLRRGLENPKVFRVLKQKWKSRVLHISFNILGGFMK